MTARVFSVTTLALVVLGGALGAAVRAALTLPWGDAAHPLVVPGVTLVINIVGSFLLAFVVGRWDSRRPHLRAFLGTGVLGGFTTYSAFAVQSVEVAGAAPIVGIVLMVASVFGGLVAAAAGLLVGRRAAGEPAVLETPESPEDAE